MLVHVKGWSRCEPYAAIQSFVRNRSIGRISICTGSYRAPATNAQVEFAAPSAGSCLICTSKMNRVIVKRNVRQYGYPPDKQGRASQPVLRQAELFSEIWAAA